MFFPTRERVRLSLAISIAAYAVGILLAGTVTALGAYRVVSVLLAELGPTGNSSIAAAVSPQPPQRSPLALMQGPASVGRQAFMTPLQAKFASRQQGAPAPRLVEPAAFGSSSRNWGRSSRRERDDDNDHDEDDEEERPQEAGTYRTMCVRLCDGYYFPISFAASRDRFARDAKACESSCGGQARLFVYRNPGADVEDMVDLHGRPYRQLSTAFLYRQEYVAACKCQPNPWDAEARERHRLYALAAAKRKGSKEAARELDVLTAKMKRDRQAQPVQVAVPADEPQARSNADKAPAPDQLHRRDRMDDKAGRMALGVRERASKARPSRSGERDPEWVNRAFGRN